MTDMSRIPPCLRALGNEFVMQRIALSAFPCVSLVKLGLCRADEVCQKGFVHRPNDYTREILRAAHAGLYAKRGKGV